MTRYVNTNYLYLGLLVQQVEHRPYADLVASLATSVGLTQTRVDPPGRPGWAGFSSGGIMATTADMAAWGEALFTPGRVLSNESLAMMASTGELGGGMGLWGVCPCTDIVANAGALAAIGRHQLIGHHTAVGGLFRFPRIGMTLVMKAERDGGDTRTRAASLAAVLEEALR